MHFAIVGWFLFFSEWAMSHFPFDGSWFLVHSALFAFSATQETGYTGRMAHRNWKEAKQQPGTAEPDNMLGTQWIRVHSVCFIGDAAKFN